MRSSCVSPEVFVIEGTGAPSNISAVNAMQRVSHNPAVNFISIAGASHFSVLASSNEVIARMILNDVPSHEQFEMTAAELQIQTRQWATLRRRDSPVHRNRSVCAQGIMVVYLKSGAKPQGPRSHRMLSKTMAKTPALAAPLLGLVLLIGANGAEAKGCIKGAVVGGVAGHVAGHHGVLGAAAGCAVGHHLAKKKQQQQLQQQQHPQQQVQPAPPQQGAPGTAAV
jgi:hypothetical protein